ncbi:sugar kinase [Streptomyces sp. NBC_00059]|uniref:sugar kinase n=1 Tax=Streptomyces sp. NBC_00059 TaxID=2975635 RepID=UPI002252EAFD|nr:sugar kinase [Streptomyces sp. NBC_00059]MCX5415933.1 sugar kinase [Streptomyces sp. NBC_00059]
MSIPAVDVLTFGEAMLSLQTDGPLSAGGTARTTVAGAEFNVAVGVARLGHRVSWAGRTGSDESGRVILRTLRGEGVETGHATTDPQAPTGAMLRERRVADLARVHYWRSGSAASRQRPEDLAPALEAGARILHLTGITCALGDGPLAAVRSAAAYAAEHGWTVTLDVNHRTRLWSQEAATKALHPLLPYVDVVIASDDELPLLSTAPGASREREEADLIAELFDAGIGEVVVKRGADGADLHLPGATPVRAAARPVPVIDTVGAGDAFCAGYLSGRLDALDPAARLQRATTTAAFGVASDGDWEGLPHRDELALLDATPGSTIR